METQAGKVPLGNAHGTADRKLEVAMLFGNGTNASWTGLGQ